MQLPFDERLTQQNGYLDRGVATTIVDGAGGYAAFRLVPTGSNILSVERQGEAALAGEGRYFSRDGAGMEGCEDA
jgi:acyl-coenzyme A thioesterase PaaI-like protein